MSKEKVILVVGGDLSERELIVRMLVAEQYRVIGAENANDALTHVDKSVDLVISDLQSRQSNGMDLIRNWKTHQPDTPFIFLTDGHDVTSVVEAMKIGAVDCVLKPVDIEELRDLAGHVLESADRGAIGATNHGVQGNSNPHNIDIPPGTSLEDLERAAVEQALAQHHGNRTHAAKTLGISVRTLQRKLKAWGMPVLSVQNQQQRHTPVFLPTHPPSSFSTTNAN